MKDRIKKFAVCLVMVPVIFMMLLVIMIMLPSLPIVALIFPEKIKLNNEDKDETNNNKT